MSRHCVLSVGRAADQVLQLAECHAMALLAQEDCAPLELQLAEFAESPGNFLLQIVRRFALAPVDLDVFCVVAAPELGLDAAMALAGHPLACDGRATPALCRQLLGSDASAALAATGLLRQAMLVELQAGSGFAQRRLTVPEAVAAALWGAPGPDAALAGVLSPCAVAEHPAAPLLADALLQARQQNPAPILHLAISDPLEAASLAAAAAARHGLAIAALDPDLLSADIGPAQAARLLNRDMVLTGTAMLVPATVEGCQIVDRLQGPFFLWGDTPQRTQRPLATWAPDTSMPRSLLPMAAMADAQASHASGFAPDLPALVRSRAAQRLDDLAQRIEPQAGFPDLVLPPAQLAQLRQLAAFRRYAPRVLDDWGFRQKSARGLSLTALFSGPSGSGKTMAAEILARELCSDGGALALYRVDLAALISKYIGETQKNIGRIFDAAEDAGAVLLFDEGEALFSRRSADVKDSHDRHANAETSYLLQRLEAYSGIAIVTTNLRSAIDDAFLRRFRAVIDFPFPDAAHRAQIWRKVLPDALPRADLDYEVLARLAITGGFIRSIALTAAWLAAEANSPLTMAHLERATRQEYGKLGKPVSEAELRGFR